MEIIKDYDTRSREASVRAEVLEAVAKVPVFAALHPGQLEYLADQMQARIYAPGERIFEQGSVGYDLHVVLEGTVELRSRDADGQERVVANAMPGSSFGEIGFLTQAPRTLSAVTGAGPSVQLVLSRFDFERIATLAPDIGYVVFEDLLRMIATRMQSLPVDQRNFLMWGYSPVGAPPPSPARAFLAVLGGGLVVTAAAAWAGSLAGALVAVTLAALTIVFRDPVVAPLPECHPPHQWSVR